MFYNPAKRFGVESGCISLHVDQTRANLNSIGNPLLSPPPGPFDAAAGAGGCTSGVATALAGISDSLHEELRAFLRTFSARLEAKETALVAACDRVTANSDQNLADLARRLDARVSEQAHRASLETNTALDGLRSSIANVRDQAATDRARLEQLLTGEDWARQLQDACAGLERKLTAKLELLERQMAEARAVDAGRQKALQDGLARRCESLDQRLSKRCGESDTLLEQVSRLLPDVEKAQELCSKAQADRAGADTWQRRLAACESAPQRMAALESRLEGLERQTERTLGEHSQGLREANNAGSLLGTRVTTLEGALKEQRQRQSQSAAESLREQVQRRLADFEVRQRQELERACQRTEQRCQDFAQRVQLEVQSSVLQQQHQPQQQGRGGSCSPCRQPGRRSGSSPYPGDFGVGRSHSQGLGLWRTPLREPRREEAAAILPPAPAFPLLSHGQRSPEVFPGGAEQPRSEPAWAGAVQQHSQQARFGPAAVERPQDERGWAAGASSVQRPDRAQVSFGQEAVPQSYEERSWAAPRVQPEQRQQARLSQGAVPQHLEERSWAPPRVLPDRRPQANFSQGVVPQPHEERSWAPPTLQPDQLSQVHRSTNDPLLPARQPLQMTTPAAPAPSEEVRTAAPMPPVDTDQWVPQARSLSTGLWSQPEAPASFPPTAPRAREEEKPSLKEPGSLPFVLESSGQRQRQDGSGLAPRLPDSFASAPSHFQEGGPSAAPPPVAPLAQAEPPLRSHWPLEGDSMVAQAGPPAPVSWSLHEGVHRREEESMQAPSLQVSVSGAASVAGVQAGACAGCEEDRARSSSLFQQHAKAEGGRTDELLGSASWLQASSMSAEAPPAPPPAEEPAAPSLQVVSKGGASWLQADASDEEEEEEQQRAPATSQAAPLPPAVPRAEEPPSALTTATAGFVQLAASRPRPPPLKEDDEDDDDDVEAAVAKAAKDLRSGPPRGEIATDALVSQAAERLAAMQSSRPQHEDKIEEEDEETLLPIASPAHAQQQPTEGGRALPSASQESASPPAPKPQRELDVAAPSTGLGLGPAPALATASAIAAKARSPAKSTGGHSGSRSLGGSGSLGGLLGSLRSGSGPGRLARRNFDEENDEDDDQEQDVEEMFAKSMKKKQEPAPVPDAAPEPPLHIEPPTPAAQPPPQASHAPAAPEPTLQPKQPPQATQSPQAAAAASNTPGHLSRDSRLNSLLGNDSDPSGGSEMDEEDIDAMLARVL